MKLHALILSLMQKAIPSCLAAACVLFIITPAHAVSFGVYTSGGYDFSTYHSGRSSSSPDYSAGAGIVLDTNVSANRSNYRLHIGYDNVISSGSKFLGRYSMHRASFINTFGFALVGNRQARIWMGPEVGLSCQFSTAGYDPVFVIVHAGGVLGINFNAGNNFTFGVELGMLAGLGANFNYPYNRSYGTGVFFESPRNDSADKAIAKVETFARISFLFRAEGD
jgi:hypothetical protein